MDQPSDSALVEMAKAGDKDAFAELYARWFDPVYDFLARMTRNRDEAADVAQDTFLKAMNALGGLQKGGSFKSWIFTIARNTALNRIEKSGRTRPLVYQDDEGSEVSLDVVDTDRFGSPEEAAEASAVATLVWEAAAGLDPKQLTLLDLHLRQGLESGEIADVLGVTRNNGYVMLNRLKKAVEDAIGAFIMFKDGRRYCDDLDSLLAVASVEGMSPDVRKLVDGHLSECSTCDERKRKLVSPLAVFGAFAAVPIPTGARAHILEGLLRDWPGPAAGAGSPLAPQPGEGGARPPGDGSPPDSYKDRFLQHGGRLIIGGAAAAVLLLLGVVLIPGLGSSDGADSASRDPTNPAASPATPPSPTSTPGSASANNPPTATPSPSPTVAGGMPTPSATSGAPAPTATSPATSTVTNSPTNTATATPTATGTPTPTPTPTPTATPTSNPCVPLLSTNTGTLTVSPGGGSSFLLLASCGSAPYTISGGDGWAITGGGGTVSFGAPRTIQVNIDTSGLSEGAHATTLEITGPNNSAFVTVQTTVGGASPDVRSFSVTCSGTAVTFIANVTDDFGVVSAVVAYSIVPTGESGSVQLEQSGNTWSGGLTLATPSESIAAATLTATDGVGHTTRATSGC